MMDLLHDTNIWVAFSFLIFLAIVWLKGRKAILGSLDARIDTIRKDIATAESLKREAGELLADYQRKHEETLREASQIMQNAEKSAVQMQRQAKATLEETMGRREKQLQARMFQMKQSAMNEIQQYAADLAIKATREIISQQLDNKGRDRLLDESIKTISRKLH